MIYFVGVLANCECSIEKGNIVERLIDEHFDALATASLLIISKYKLIECIDNNEKKTCLDASATE
jgi:hypothetical protein